MKVTKIMTLKLLLALTVAIGFTSCSKSGSTKGGSSATGWQINDKKGGFQYNTNYKKQETPPGMTSIEGGTFTMGKVEDDVMHDWNNTPTKQHVQSFYMDETEITNSEYRQFIEWVKDSTIYMKLAILADEMGTLYIVLYAIFQILRLQASLHLCGSLFLVYDRRSR